MVNPIFGVDVSGIQWFTEYTEGVKPTGAYQFVAPELRASWQAGYSPYPVQALGSRDIADFVTGQRMDMSQFTFDLTASGIQHLKHGINLGSASISGAYWSQAYVGRIYSQTDAQTKFWEASGARTDTITIGPGAASWQVTETIVHKPPTITGAAQATGIYFTEWPGAALDPVLNPHTVGSGSLFTFNAAPWYIASLGLQVSNNQFPIALAGEQNISKFIPTARTISFMVSPYEENLSTYISALNTVGTGVVTLATGRTLTLTGLYFYGIQQLPFNPMAPATVGLVGTARNISLAG
jgi:hypothetical protein